MRISNIWAMIVCSLLTAAPSFSYAAHLSLVCIAHAVGGVEKRTTIGTRYPIDVFDDHANFAQHDFYDRQVSFLVKQYFSIDSSQISFGQEQPGMTMMFHINRENGEFTTELVRGDDSEASRVFGTCESFSVPNKF